MSVRNIQKNFEESESQARTGGRQSVTVGIIIVQKSLELLLNDSSVNDRSVRWTGRVFHIDVAERTAGEDSLCNVHMQRFLEFFNTIFVSSHMYPENPEGTQVIVGSMNMGYISDTARNRTHNLFRPKRESIPLGHSDGLQVRLEWSWCSLKIEHLGEISACHDGAGVSASGLTIGRSPVQISPKTNVSNMIKLPVKSTGK